MTTRSRHALLVRESANRVYQQDAPRLAVAELAAVSTTLDTPVSDVTADTIAGVDYVTFDAEAFGEADRIRLSDLSSCRALFRVDSDGRFDPLPVSPTARFDDDLITIQRYPGKTNEQFTHLLVNVTTAASAAARERASQGRPVRLLDPVAGRGSSLNRALVLGFDAAGIEVVEADVDQYRTFVTTYLKDHRVKHRVTRERVRKGPLAGTWRFGVTIAGSQELEMVRGETEQAAELFAGRSFDVVVGDLPYGVQHRAGATGARRSIGDLVQESIAGWVALMRRGAAIGLAWNVRTMPRGEVVAILEGAGLTVVEHPHPFEHAVDRAISRDLVVATR